MDDKALLGALDEGLRTGMLDEIQDANLVYRVHHELLRRTVYERLSSLRAAALHLRVGEALEAMPEARRDRIVTIEAGTSRRTGARQPGDRDQQAEQQAGTETARRR